MAEGYVRTSAGGVHQLLGVIAEHAQAHGWNLHDLGGVANPGTGGTTRRCHLSNGGVTVNFQSQLHHDRNASFYVDLDAVRVCASTDYSGSAAWDAQPSSSPAKAVGLRDDIPAVHLFFLEHPAAIYVVLESSPGRFSWLAAGMVEKAHDLSGGQFVGASEVSYLYQLGLDTQHLSGCDVRIVHNDVASAVSGWGGVTVATPGGLIPTNSSKVPQQPGHGFYAGNTLARYSIDWLSDMVDGGYDGATGRLRLFPASVYANRKSGGLSQVGRLPSVYYCSLEPFAGGEEFVQDGVTYMVFPVGVRLSPFNLRTDYTLSTLQTSDGPLTVQMNHHFGVGFALRKPT